MGRKILPVLIGVLVLGLFGFSQDALAFSPESLDTTGVVGQATSIAIGSDNFPVISYFDSSKFDLKLVHCTNTTCSDWDAPESLVTTGFVGSFTSIAIGFDDFPVISYYDALNRDLKLVHCTNVSCTSADVPITLDSAGNVGRHTSIAIGSDNFPVISYYDVTNGDLKLVHCTNTTCSDWDTPESLDTTGVVGQDTSIAIGSDNFPVISYYDSINFDLKLVHCTDVSCTTAVVPITLDTTDFVGQFTSIAIGSDNFPVISYYDVTNDDLKLVHCTNTTCSARDAPESLDTTGVVGSYTSIAIGFDDFPVISYYDGTNGDLKLVHTIPIPTGPISADHYLGYDAKRPKDEPKFEKFTVELSDQFEMEPTEYTVEKPDRLYNPVQKTHDGTTTDITDFESHYVGYKIKTPKGDPKFEKVTDVLVQNQFGDIIVDVKKPKLLLVPSAKSHTDEFLDVLDNPVNHYKCYDVKVTKHTPKFKKLVVTLYDPNFEIKQEFEVKKPKHLCTPVQKTLEDGSVTPIEDPVNHLMCYDVKKLKDDPKFEKLSVFTNNQFGPEDLEVKKVNQLCLPSIKTLP